MSRWLLTLVLLTAFLRCASAQVPVGGAAAVSPATPHQAEAWNVSNQPDLKQALEQAPILLTESLGEPSLGVNTWEHST